MIRIRPATIEDADPLARLMGTLGYPTDAAAMRMRLERLAADDGYATFVAEAEGGPIVGMVGVMRFWAHNQDASIARVLALVVDERRRGEGAGAALMRRAEQWSRAAGASSIHLTTALHRGDAHVFYQRIGYEPTGTRFFKRLA